MPEKNQICTVTADDITFEGMGVGRADGMAVFAPDLLPGEQANVKIIKKLKSYCIARTEERLTDSPLRAEPLCPVFRECGGCTHSHLSYAGQLKYKTSHVAGCLRKFSGTELVPFDCEASPESLHYRNKVSLPVEKKDGRVLMGCYKKHSHQVIDAPICLIADKALQAAADDARQFLEQNDISVYSEETGRGLVRHVILRKSSLGEIMLGFVLNGSTLPHSAELIDTVRAHGSASTVVINENRGRGNAILGDNTRAIYGSGRIREKILNCLFDISLNTFLQINHAQTEKLYSYAISLLGENSVVCDLYCGAGTITLNAAFGAKKIYGVEIVPSAVEDARRNAALNGVTNAEFILGDCAEALPQIIKNEGRIDAVIVDPPRKGLEKSVIADIAASGAAKVIYVSCDPATLSRDIKIFSENGYTPLSAQPFDMFPQTGHVETVCLMSRVEGK